MGIQLKHFGLQVPDLKFDLSGKATISPQGTATVKYNFSDTDNLSATQLSNYDPQIGSLFLNPKVALGSRIEFDVKASSVYSYFDTDKVGGAGQVSIETDLTTILVDPFVFSFVL